ncbi:MAG: TlpA family protein disulfide reductase [Flavobacteriaceae bacterium]|nr:TlpA family protein disulfide reductase [Eudoraea sp.]NNJ37792.1 TlpA family protein disulfide reductase [Flavobacteriaceae bacterium]
MRKKRINWFWLLLLIGLALYLFTPLGFHAQVFVNRVFSHNPEPVASRTADIPDLQDWELTDMEGKTFPVISVKGEVTLLNFWASWCPPCVAEMPSLDTLYGDYKDQVRFLFIARDQKERVTNYLEKEGYDFPVYFERGLTPKKLYYGGLPTTYILDKSGKITVAHSGAADWNAPEVRDLLDSLLVK